MCEPAPLRLVSVLRSDPGCYTSHRSARDTESRYGSRRFWTHGGRAPPGPAEAGRSSGRGGALAPGGLRVVAGQLHAAALTPRARHGRRPPTEVRDELPGGAAGRARLGLDLGSLVGGRHRRVTLAAG